MNGALDPDKWHPVLNAAARWAPVAVGELVAWRYGAWRVLEVDPVPDVDLTDAERVETSRWGRPPYRVVLRHERGPLLLAGREFQRLHDGSLTVHWRVQPMTQLYVLPEPFKVCSCHGYPWPCQDVDRAEMATRQVRQMNRLLAATQPRVCANCLQRVTVKQKALCFPEPSELVPGAAGPLFHAGRSMCWRGARDYELGKRLPAHPHAQRLASCPGFLFVHADAEVDGSLTGRREECTAGRDCTFLHGPRAARRPASAWCFTRTYGRDGGHPVPLVDCGYRMPAMGLSCLAAGSPLDGWDPARNQRAGDLIWEAHHRILAP